MAAPGNELAFDLDVALAAAARWDKRDEQHTKFKTAADEGRYSAIDTPERIAKRTNRLLTKLNDTAPEMMEAVAAEAPATAESTMSASLAPDDADDALLERVIGATRDFQFIEFLSQALFVSRSVGRVVTKLGGGRSSFGTGFLVSPRLLMTNHHVLPSADVAARSAIEFDFQRDRLGVAAPVAAFKLDPATFFLNDKRLDFALVAVSASGSSRSLDEFGWCPLIKEEGKIVVGEAINIVQHPLGEMKQVVVRENRLQDMLDLFAHYEADTEPGSSGSPVFNDQWEVIALHHSGVPKRNSKGEILDTNNKVWKKGDDPTRIAWVSNEGVRVSKLVQFIAAASVPGNARGLLRELLDAKPPVEGPRPAPTFSDAPSLPKRSVVNEKTTTHSVTAGLGGVTVQIPLNITITLGTPTVGGVATPATPVSPPPSDELQFEKITPDPSDKQFKKRPGYQPDFLGNGLAVPLPTLTPGIRKKAFALPGVTGNARFELKYHHYSVLFNKDRKLAFVSAVNYDPTAFAIPRDKDGDKWFFDPRVPKEFQAGEGLYSKNDFDRGHLTRRADAGWGADEKEAKLANDDTFHFTNCSPQHFVTNQGKANQAPAGLKLWGKLEDHVAAQGKKDKRRLCVFNGPVFRDSDTMYRNICAIPLDYWKLIAFERDDGELGVAAFVLTQATLVGDMLEEFRPGEFEAVQKSVEELETLTGLDFGPLRQRDVLGQEGMEESFAEAAEGIPLTSVSDVVL